MEQLGRGACLCKSSKHFMPGTVPQGRLHLMYVSMLCFLCQKRSYSSREKKVKLMKYFVLLKIIILSFNTFISVKLTSTY